MYTNFTQDMDTGQNPVVSLTEVITLPVPDLRPWDNSDPFFSARTRDLIKTVFTCYVRPVIIVLGIPGNIISCLVFFKQGLSDRINLLLFWLAVADLTLLTGHLLILPSCLLSDTLQRANWDVIWNAKIGNVIRWINNTSGALIMIMSVDRCLSVVMPLRANRLLSYRPMVAAILLSYMIPFVLFLNLFLAFTVQWKVESSVSGSIAYMSKTSWFPVDSKYIALLNYVFSVIIKPVFLCIVVICCIITISHLRQASRQRLQMTWNTQEKDNSGNIKITRMLLFLCAVYAVLLLPQIGAAITYTLVPEFYLYRQYHNTRVVFAEVLVLPTSCINSAVNFFAYVTLSSKFRATLKQVSRCFH